MIPPAPFNAWPFFGSRKIGGSKRSRNFFITLFYHIHMGVSKNRGTPTWMVYNGKPYWNGWFGGTLFLETPIYHLYSEAVLAWWKTLPFPTEKKGNFRQLHWLHQKYNVRTMTRWTPTRLTSYCISYQQGILFFWTQHPSKGTITLKNLNWIMDSFWIPSASTSPPATL